MLGGAALAGGCSGSVTVPDEPELMADMPSQDAVEVIDEGRMADDLTELFAERVRDAQQHWPQPDEGSRYEEFRLGLMLAGCESTTEALQAEVAALGEALAREREQRQLLEAQLAALKEIEQQTSIDDEVSLL